MKISLFVCCFFSFSYILNRISDKRLDETCLNEDFRDEVDEDLSISNYYAADEILLKRLKISLAGVLPPPLLTYPQQKVEEILQIWKNSSTFSNLKIEKTNVNNCKINCSLEKVLSCEWPSIKYCLFHGVSYNLGDISEQIADLFDKYRERYVGCETSSFINANSSEKELFNGMKNRRKAYNYSPGQRLSHLAKRRTVFSSASLLAASNANATTLKQKTIFINSKIKKNPKRALFVSPEEKTKTSNYGRRSPSRLKSLQLKRSLWLRKKCFKINTPTKQTPKKHLTPKKLTPRKSITPSKRTPNKMPGKSITPSKRTPKKTPGKSITPNKNKYCYQTKIFTSEAYHTKINESGTKVNMNLELKNDDVVFNCSGSSNKDSSREESNSFELSDSQRRKLLWAVSAALKNVGVRTNHKNFRIYGKKLYKLCKNFWVSHTRNKTLKTGISELMMSLASEHVESIMKEVEDTNVDDSEFYSQDSCDFFFRKND